MTALFAGELRRLLARRLVRVMGLLAVLIIGLAGVLTFLNTDDTDEAALAASRVRDEAFFQECLERQGPPPSRFEPGVAGRAPPAGSFDRPCFPPPGGVRDDRLLLTAFDGILLGTTAPFVIVAWLLGASAIGADWQSRTLTTTLTWEPRRVRVLLTKAAAAMTVAAGFFLLGQSLLSAALLPSVLLHGTTAGADGEFARSLSAVVGRGAAMVAFGAGIGFALASVGRNTAAAMGVGFAYIVVIENVVGQFLEDWRRWLLLGNIIVFVSGEADGGSDGVPGRSVLGAGLFLTAVTLALLLAAAAIFRRRDVA